MDVFWPALFLTTLGLFCAVSCIRIADLPHISYEELGDVNLGVLVPVHHLSIDSFCATEVRDLGTLQRIEAIVQVKQLSLHTMQDKV